MERFTQKGSTNVFAGWMLRLPTWAGLAFLSLLVRAGGVLRVRVGRRDSRSCHSHAGADRRTVLRRRRRPAPRRGLSRLLLRGARAAPGPKSLLRSLHECESTTIPPYYRRRQRNRSGALSALRPGVLLSADVPIVGDAMFAWWIALALAISWRRMHSRASQAAALVGWAALALAGVDVVLIGERDAGRDRGDRRGGVLCRAESPGSAAVAIAVAMVEPQIALPAAVALFVAIPGRGSRSALWRSRSAGCRCLPAASRKASRI